MDYVTMSSTDSKTSEIELELYFLIARFLSSGPCKDTFEALKRELDQKQLLPKRIDWEGDEHFRSFENLTQIYPHISPLHLLKICSRIGPILDKEIPPSVSGVNSLLGAGRQSLLRTVEETKCVKWNGATYAANRHGKPLFPPHNFGPSAPILSIYQARETSGLCRKSHAFPLKLCSKISLLSRSLGHLSAVYCVTFDRTGEFIITGSDDHLIKIWSSITGRLLATLRGHSAEIADIAVNYENTLLASGSCDKTIRVWNLRNTAPVAVLPAHTGAITSIQFCPLERGETRFLASTGADGCVCFWSWNVKTKQFNYKPYKFIERSRAGAQMLCSSFSPGGVFLATGNSDQVIRVYCFLSNAPEKICELEAHSDKIDSIQYANCEDRFVTGSKDGTARIWRYFHQEWKAIVLNISKRMPGQPPCTKMKCTMIGWSQDDEIIFTAVTDCTIKLWDSRTGELLKILEGHKDEVYVLEHNPVENSLLLSAGHDGNIFIWDINTGIILKSYFNTIQGQGHGAVFDCKWSPNGQYIAATDSHGFLMLFGYGSNERYKQNPDEQYFHTDYRPLIRDANNYVLDEQTQTPPHLMPPPFSVDIDGNPHPAKYQRLVPGREQSSDASLVPQVGVAPNGDREVLDFSLADQEPEVVEPLAVVIPEAAPSTSQPSPRQPAEPEQNNGDMDIIDHMIANLQQQQDERLVAAGGEPLLSPTRSTGEPFSPTHRSSRMSVDESASTSQQRSSRRSIEGEGSRSPRIQRRLSGVDEARLAEIAPVPATSDLKNISVWSKRVCVRKLDTKTLKHNHGWRYEMSELELKKFVHERKRKPLPPSEADSSDSSSYMRTRKKRRNIHGYRTRANRNEETGRNRLVTRALYDTEVEEQILQDDEIEDEEEEEAAVATILGNSALAASDDMWKSESGSESSDYSDWAVDATQTLQPPKRRSTRKVRRKKYSSSESEAEESDHEEREVRARSPTRRKERKKPIRRPPQRRQERKESRRERKQRVVKQLDIGDVSEVPEAFRPPEWLSDSAPRKAPYFPQMGDEVIYFRQGHSMYVDAVKRRNVYDIDPKKNQPWHKNPNLREQELARVVGIKYEIKPPRLVCLKLAFIDPENGKPTGGSFQIKYHDMPDVLDFIVLRQHYDRAMQYNWNVGDRFRCIIDDGWWHGTIESQEPFQEFFPDSLFQCFNVAWDNGEFEKMSPWDLEPIDESRRPDRRGGSVPVRQEEIASLLYNPVASEWPPCGRDVECDRICEGLDKVMELSIAENFLAPVDLNAFPTYAMIVEYPIDLSLIKDRLQNRFYRRVTSIQYDVRYVENNAVQFNQPHSQIVNCAKLTTELLLRFISNPDVTDPVPLYHELSHDADFIHAEQASKSSSSEAEEGTSRSYRRIKSNRPGGSSRSKKTDPNMWKQDCVELLTNIIDNDDSAPFRTPVDPETFHDYLEVVDTPMDFGTVQEKLLDDEYDNPNDLANDVRLIFENSRAYNTNKRSQIYIMTLRLKAFFEAKFGNIVKDWKMVEKSIAKNGRKPMLRSKSKQIRSMVNGSKTRGSSSQRSSMQSSKRRVLRRTPPDQPTSSRSRRSEGTTPSSGSTGGRSERINGHSRTRSSRRVIKRRRLLSEENAGTDDEDEEEEEVDVVNGHGNEEESSSQEDSESEFEYKEGRKPVKQAARRISRKPTRPPPLKRSRLTNGYGASSSSRKTRSNQSPEPRYGTRTASGSVIRRNYNNDYDSEEELQMAKKISRQQKRKRPQSPKQKSSDTSQSESGTSSSSSDEEKGDNDKSSDAESSGSQTEDYEQKDETPPSRRNRRPPEKYSPSKRSQPSRPSPVRARSRPSPVRASTSRGAGSKSVERQTRYQGKRTVTYEEDSDFDVGSRQSEEIDNDDDNDNENDSGDGLTVSVTTVSSRGRVRKIKHRAEYLDY